MKSNGVLKIATLIFAIAVVGLGVVGFQLYGDDSEITLNGEKNVTVGLNGFYEDPGVTAIVDGQDVSDTVEVSGEPDFTVPGDYQIEYRIGNKTLVRTVTVADKMDPEIVLKDADKTISLKIGEDFEEPGYTATDSNGNDLTDAVVVTGTECMRAGNQQIEYTVSDSQGKKTRVCRTIKVEPNTEYRTSGLPICMYHYVYSEDDPPTNLNANYISATELDNELTWLQEHEFYFPTWDEVIDYINGELYLPPKSVVLTFDDASISFLQNGVPVLEKHKIPATCFVVTSKSGKSKMEKYASDYVEFQSESDNMHRGGGNVGHGGIFTVLSHDEALADLKKSIEIVGNDDVFAYPFGDYNDACVEIVKEAGFKCAVTTRQGRVKPGDDPYRLPRQRMGSNQSMETFRTLVLPY